MAQNLTKSSYRPLNEQQAEIRLLKILPEVDGFPICCRLQTVSLLDCSIEFERYRLSCSDGNAPTIRDLLRDPGLRKRWTARAQFADIPSIRRLASLQAFTGLQRFAWGDFASLSYVWGKSSSTRAISIDGREVQVTANLESALRQFRSDGLFSSRFLLWVDALCINQSDVQERAKEVQRMKEIYGSSWTVVAWLGKKTDNSDAGIQLLRDMATFRDAGRERELEIRLQDDPKFLGSTCWMGLHRLVNRKYWERLWIIQEIVMGGYSVWIRCGASTIDWETFCKGIAVLQEHLWLVKDRCLREDVSRNGVAWSTLSSHLIYQDLSILHQTPLAENPGLAFGRLLDLAIAAECTDPRDRVYALLGLLPSEVASLVRPDYTISPSAVYTRIAQAFIQAYNSLDLLREGNPWGLSGCPSWAADWTWSGRGRHSRVERPLWGPAYLFPPLQLANQHFTPFRASGDVGQKASIGDAGFLSCKGFIIDEISGISARELGYFDWDHNSRSSPRNWRSAYGDFASTRDALVRTLVHDRVNAGQRPEARHNALLHLPSTWEEAGPQFIDREWRWLAGQEGYYFRWERFREAIDGFGLGEWRFGEFFDNDIPADADEYDYTEVYACSERSAMRRRFITTKAGYMGWAPDNMYGRAKDQVRVGDLIGIVLGCSTPLVIRPNGDAFQVLGEAYVHCVMDGEAMSGLASDQYKLRELIFC
ncbi:hypothetical protein HBH46_207640 [Parastagonospora nodorum]|nr:hypothetical protein HBH46_207640 [Parastagonospora nodorum]